MYIKDIILNGGSVSFSYKENKKEWMGSAKIIPFSGGFGLKPKIIVEVPTSDIKGRKEFTYDKIDEAIELFKSLVFREKNLCYKMHEAMVSITNNGFDLDLEDEDDYRAMNKLRLQLINKNK